MIIENDVLSVIGMYRYAIALHTETRDLPTTLITTVSPRRNNLAGAICHTQYTAAPELLYNIYLKRTSAPFPGF